MSRAKKPTRSTARTPKTFKALLTRVSIEEVEGLHPMSQGRAWQFDLSAMQNEPPGNNPPTMTYLLFEQQVMDIYDLLGAEIQKNALKASTPPSGDPSLH